MKTELPKRSKSQDHEIVIHEMCDIIIEHFANKVAFVILYGSFARGNWVYDIHQEDHHRSEYASDYDLCIVTKKNKHGAGLAVINLKNDIYAKLKNYRKPYRSHNPSIIVEPLDIINKELEKGSYFLVI